MVVINGTHAQNDNTSRLFFQFFKILIFWDVRGGWVKGQKTAQDHKKSVSHFISQERYII